MAPTRYLVRVDAPGTDQLTILIPFAPHSILTSFVEELWKRLARHKTYQLSPSTHKIVLHFDNTDGAVIDLEDVLSDVIQNPAHERICAVITSKSEASAPASSEVQLRIIQTTDPKDRASCHMLNVSLTDTVQNLHDAIANSLGLTTSPDVVDSNECNCVYSRQVAEGASKPGSFVVIHDKSIVERILLPTPTKAALQEALEKLDFVAPSKRVSMFGEVMSMDNQQVYEKTPVVSLCSEQRHIPTHARADFNRPSLGITFQDLDLHTAQQPIHRTCFAHTIQDLGLSALAIDGIIDIFVVPRSTQGTVALTTSKSTIFAHQIHWEPPVAQSDRGLAMFLSSLRVFTSLVQDLSKDELMQEAVFRVFDQLTHFLPALRCLAILTQGRTPTAQECAALSHAFFNLLDTHFVTLKMILNSDRNRLFEGSRLLFGFILESARSVKALLEAEPIRYSSAFTLVDVRDCKTTEAVSSPIQTLDGLVEENLFRAFQPGGILSESHLQSFMTKTTLDANLARFAKLSGGIVTEVMTMSTGELRHSEDLPLEMHQLSDPGHLAELCGRNNLAVYQPSQLDSAIAPCLTFDRKAHLAVYTGQQPCGLPGKSSLAFRPQHGEETIDPTLIEQIISPILATYVADGTAVLDLMGGAEVKRMQNPTEILVFCVDSSNSMRDKTEFKDVNEEDESEDEESAPVNAVQSVVGSCQPLPLEQSHTMLLDYEGYHDMIAIIAAAPQWRKDDITDIVWSICENMLAADILEKKRELDGKSQYVSTRHARSQQMRGMTDDLNRIVTVYSTFHNHRHQLKDLLRSNAAGLPQGHQKWTWSFGEEIPAQSSFEVMSPLRPDITEVPHDLKCPVGHILMQQAVQAADGFTYDRGSIEKYLTLNPQPQVYSPMYRALLSNRTLKIDGSARRKVDEWISGVALLDSSPEDLSNCIRITFRSRAGSFSRIVPLSTSLTDVYKVAFRALAAQFEIFQLIKNDNVIEASDSVTVASSGLFRDGDDIHIRIPEETRAFRTMTNTEPSTSTTGQTSHNMYLIKVFTSRRIHDFAFWVRHDSKLSIATVIWKFWRYKSQQRRLSIADVREQQCWTGLYDRGDERMGGYPPRSSERLATYLTRHHCKGQLGSEALCASRDVNASDDEASMPGVNASGNVLKLYIIDRRTTAQSQHRQGKLSRLDVLKQMFEALINRMVAYGYRTHVGLVNFASKAQIKIPISHVLENFRRATTELDGAGDTALWDALTLASDHLREYAQAFPNAKKRIICISDGKDTKSRTDPSAIWASLQSHNIAVDSICLGNEDNVDLRTLSYLLGGYRFQPETLENAMSICEMEPFLALGQRPDITHPKPVRGGNLSTFGRFYAFTHKAGRTVVTDDIIPPMRLHPNLGDEFVELTALAAQNKVRSHASTDPSSSTSGRLRTYRLMNEMKAIAATGHPGRDVYVSTADMSFWKIVIQGPEDSPYSEGRFLMYLHADETFPAFAPKTRFVTQIKHPNVNPHGRICHSILNRDWTSDTSITAVLDTIYALLFQPEHGDPVNTTTTLEFHHDEVEFSERVREHVRKHASLTRAEWRAQILGDEDTDDESSYEEL